MKLHLNWTTSISSKLLNSKKLLLDSLVTLEVNSTPFDEIAILAFARMYHCHIAILMSGRYWCTNKDQDYSRCSIFLLWYGGLKFIDTKEKDLLIPPPKSTIEDCDTTQKSFIPQQESNIQDCDTTQKSFIPQQESNIQDCDTTQKSFIRQPKTTSLAQEAITYNLRT